MPNRSAYAERMALVLGPILRHVDETSALLWVQTDTRATVEICGCRTDTFEVLGHHYALVEVSGLAPDSTTEYRVRVDGVVEWPLADSDFPPSVIRTRGPAGAPAPVGVRLVPLPEGRGPRGRRGTRARRARPLCRADAEPAGVRLAGHVDPARRSGLRRRADPAGEGEAGIESLVARRTVGRGGRLRGIRRSVPPHVGRPGDPMDHVHRPDRDDLRRPRHPRRLEHLGCVASPDVSRFRSSWRGMAPLSATKSRQSRQNSLPSGSWRTMCPACSGGCGS